MIFIFLGPPGSGKGTQAKRLSSKLGLPHIAVGDILREAVRHGTELGKKAKQYMDFGKLVPDELTIKITNERLGKEDCQAGFILDGYPRSIEQSKALDAFLKGAEFKVVYFDASAQTVIERNAGRLSCPKCFAVYHKKNQPPKEDQKCDRCGSDLYQRKDDTEEVIKTRFAVYDEATRPLVELYKQRGKLLKIDASGGIEKVFERLTESLKV